MKRQSNLFCLEATAGIELEWGEFLTGASLNADFVILNGEEDHPNRNELYHQTTGPNLISHKLECTVEDYT